MPSPYFSSPIINPELEYQRSLIQHIRGDYYQHRPGFSSTIAGPPTPQDEERFRKLGNYDTSELASDWNAIQNYRNHAQSLRQTYIRRIMGDQPGWSDDIEGTPSPEDQQYADDLASRYSIEELREWGEFCEAARPTPPPRPTIKK